VDQPEQSGGEYAGQILYRYSLQDGNSILGHQFCGGQLCVVQMSACCERRKSIIVERERGGWTICTYLLTWDTCLGVFSGPSRPFSKTVGNLRPQAIRSSLLPASVTPRPAAPVEVGRGTNEV
jgi:hypothetical protein